MSVEPKESVKLNAERRQILEYLLRHESEGPMWNEWIAEGCGRYYDSAWAANRTPGLAKHGLIERTIPGYYRITEAGRAALTASEVGK